MNRFFIISVLCAFVFLSACTKETGGDVRPSCCAECLDAFSQSPVGVGEEAVACGAFTSSLPISEECEAYFKNYLMTVAQCRELQQR